jgi:hypothetical protein
MHAQVLVAPQADRLNDRDDAPAVFGQHVLDPRRHFGVDGPQHQPVVLQLAQ